MRGSYLNNPDRENEAYMGEPDDLDVSSAGETEDCPTDCYCCPGSYDFDPGFKPSDVVLGVPPLVDTMGSARAEHAAAVLVRACVRNGDSWETELPANLVTDAIKADVDEGVKPMCDLVKNPFFLPSIFAIVQRGFADWVENPAGPVRFNAKGIGALRKWARNVRL